MPEFFSAPCSVQLVNEVNHMFPHRDKSSDGWIGDASHAARPSEHNPCWTCRGRLHGIVMARDIDVDDGDPGRDIRKMLLHELIGDPRVWYVISNGIIYSRTHGWQARRYTGSNGHFHHVHVSFLLSGAFDTRPFFGPVKPVRTTPAKLDVSKLREAFLAVAVEHHKPSKSVDVARYQRLLNARTGSKLTADGIIGPATLNAEAVLEQRFGGTGRPRVPEEPLIRKANKGMFQVVA